MNEVEDKKYEKRRAVVLFLLAPVFILAGVTLIFVLILITDPDVAKAYPNPERHEGVRRFQPKTPAPANLPGREERFDFDGDGVADVLSLEYFNMEPLFRPATSGMVFVHSGATGEVLVAHAVPTPLDYPKWYGDIDGNGTTDILVRSKEPSGGRVVLGAVDE